MFIDPRTELSHIMTHLRSIVNTFPNLSQKIAATELCENKLIPLSSSFINIILKTISKPQNLSPEDDIVNNASQLQVFSQPLQDGIVTSSDNAAQHTFARDQTPKKSLQLKLLSCADPKFLLARKMHNLSSNVSGVGIQAGRPTIDCTQRQFHSSCMCPMTVGEGKIASQKRQPMDYEIEALIENSQEVILQYADLLGCSWDAVADMIRYEPKLVSEHRREEVIAKIKLLIEAGFSAREILGRCQVFSRSIAHLVSRLEAMQSVKHYRYRIAHVFLTSDAFRSRMADYRKEVAVMGDHPSQVSFVAHLLEFSEGQVVSLSKQPVGDFLLTFAPSRLRDTVSTLQSFGVSKEMMREKILMLRTQPEVIRDRLQRMLDAGVFDLQRVPSALYNHAATFDASFITWVRNAQALTGFASERQLLKTRLQCSEAEVTDLFHRKPNVARLRSAKLKRCLDILQDDIGVSSASILLYGDLLHFSPRRLLSRWAVLKELGLSEPALVKDLLLTERQFTAKYGFESK